MRKLFIVFVLILSQAALYCQTEVKGGIFSNTTWTKDKSPYIVKDNIVVFEECNLKIEPGVTIKIDDGKYFLIRGSIQCNGKMGDSIIFTSNSINPSTNSWKGVKFSMNNTSYNQISCAKIEYASLALSYFKGSLKKSHFQYNDTVFQMTSIMDIDSCLFNNNKRVVWEPVYIGFNNCIFINNDIGVQATVNKCKFIGNKVFGAHGGSVKNSIFSNNEVGIECSELADSNVITNNKVGIKTLNVDCTISNNTISNNKIGLLIDGRSYGNTTSIIKNRFCNNTDYNVQNSTEFSINMSKNYWCSLDSSLIRASIYDAYNDISLGLINFMPFLTDTLTQLLISNYDKQIDVFPNPSNNKIKVKGIQNESRVSILDVNGTIIKSHLTDNNQIDISKLNKGVYFLIIKIENKTIYKKFVKE